MNPLDTNITSSSFVMSVFTGSIFHTRNATIIEYYYIELLLFILFIVTHKDWDKFAHLKLLHCTFFINPLVDPLSEMFKRLDELLSSIVWG